MKKIILSVVAAVVIAGGSAFYGGVKYGQNKERGQLRNARGFTNLSPEERQMRFAQFNIGGAREARAGNEFVAGEILSRDEQSITLKLRDNGSKIVIIAPSTIITKNAAGSVDDLAPGSNVVISGQTNQDGSISAESIQLRP